MTRDQLVALLESYRCVLLAEGAIAEEAELARRFDPTIREDRSAMLNHALFMLDLIKADINGVGGMHRTLRFVGIYQGLFWALGLFSISDIRRSMDHMPSLSRSPFNGA